MKHIPAPTDLRVDLLKTPYGVRRDRLAFSWVMTAAPEARNTRQTAYRITVAEGIANAAAGHYIHDTDWVSSADSTSVRPVGLADTLSAGKLYYWQVAVRDGEGGESPLSPPQAFTVGADWVSTEGIWAQEGDFAFLRREFCLAPAAYAELDRALLTVTATSPEPSRQFVYNLYVNGAEAGVGPCRLGKTPDGETVIYYQTYDITSLLLEGKNCIAAVCYALADRGFLCQLTVYGRDGAPRVITDTGTDANGWQALCGDAVYGKTNSIGTHYFTAHACNVDARIFPFGFAEAGFDTDRDHGGHGWTAPRRVGALMGGLRLLPSDTEPVGRYATPAAASETLPDGTQLIDLGAEIIGGLRWTADVPCDCTVTLTYGEQIAEGRVKCPMNTGNTYRETWTLRAGRQTIETLGMMAFRWVQVEGCPVRIAPDTVWGLEIRKPFDETASALTSDNDLLCALHRLTKHTVKVTSQDIYVDSQSRERGAYEGDLFINMLAAYAMEDSFAPARLTAEYLLGHRTWPADYLLMIIFAARADYMATGDTSLLAEWYDTLKEDLFTNYLDETGLIRSPVIGMSVTNAVLVDWPASERDGYEIEVPYNTVFNALNVRAYADMAQIAAVLGRDTDAMEFSIRADTLRNAMIDRLFDGDTGRFRDGVREDGQVSDHAAQHATAFCLSCGVYADQRMADAMARALDRDGKIRMSVYGAFFLLEGLYRTGNGAVANRLMLNGDNSEGARTWAYMIHGLNATVTTEAWNQRNKPNMTLSHPWGAAPAHMIASGIFGITPTSPAYETFDVRICPAGIGDAGIGEAAVTVPTVRGKIKAAFRQSAEELILDVTVPANTAATVYLPDGKVHTRGAGAWRYTVIRPHLR